MAIKTKQYLALAALGLALSAAQASSVELSLLSATAGVTNAAAAVDGFVPANGTPWQTTAAWWQSTSDAIVFSFDQAYHLSSATVTADWNDVYRFYVSQDGVNFTPLFTVSGLFDQSGVSSGQVTMTASFAATAEAYQYLKVQALMGDNAFALGEISLNGTVAAVPEPGTLAFMAGGLGLLALAARRRKA